jgi:dTDP-4-dehydrorhamnose 3,5-epimerase
VLQKVSVVAGNLDYERPSAEIQCAAASSTPTQRSLHIPASCAHGFQAPTEPADTSYRIDRVHERSDDLTIAYDDPELAVPWPFPVTAMSDSDRTAKPLRLLTAELMAIRA